MRQNLDRYWDKPWSLVAGCTPCSPGCDHCWSAAMEHRFGKQVDRYFKNGLLTNEYGKFNGNIITHPERLNIPLKCKKPTVYAVWNDLFHEDVPTEFIDDTLEVMAACSQHTFLALTKRAHLMEEKVYGVTPDHGCRELGGGDYLPNIWWGLTICNQWEADEKIPIFLQVPGKKFLSIEPCLSEIDFWQDELKKLAGIILGGETGPGARPMHPDWVRSVRDQCAAAGVPFFFKGWGSNLSLALDQLGVAMGRFKSCDDAMKASLEDKAMRRFLDGRTHNDLPWRKINGSNDE